MMDLTDDPEEAVAVITAAEQRRTSSAPGAGESPSPGTRPD